MGLKFKWNKNLAIAIGVVVALFVIGGIIFWTNKKDSSKKELLSTEQQEMERMMNESVGPVSPVSGQMPAIQQAPNMHMSQTQMSRGPREIIGINMPQQDKTQMEMQYGSPMGYDPRTDGLGVGQGIGASVPQTEQYSYL